MLDVSKTESVLIGGNKAITLDQMVHVAKGGAEVRISTDNAFVDRMERSCRVLKDALAANNSVYGVTTGFGKSCGNRMAEEAALKNGLNLVRFHGCGTGETLPTRQVRAAMLARMACFARGYSGVSLELLTRMADFLNHGITPVMPAEGSVGASGDLTPMSYVAAALMGERDVFYRGQRVPSAEALADTGLSPYTFKAKETLAIMNGTSVMTGIAAMVAERADRLMRACIAATALSVHALMGNIHHYHPVIAESKPYPGQSYVAERIFSLLVSNGQKARLESDALDTFQDPYSLRCAPQIVGVLIDALTWVRNWVEIEINSANDNPIFDGDTGLVLMGGNFYGGHIAFAMDALKSALASVADMSDRQIAMMVDPNVNRGLPADLVRQDGDDRLFNHGFKAMSIASSALSAEALKLTMPAASFSRSTESHNQDKVSMGTIAARDADRVCSLAERVVAVHLLTSVQACEIRQKADARPELVKIIGRLRVEAAPVMEDRPMDADIEKTVKLIRETDFFNTMVC